MKMRIIFAVLVVVSATVALNAQTGSPDLVVRDLYRVHNKGYGPVFDQKGRSNIFKYFERRLADLLWLQITSTSEEVGNLDFDPLYNAQDVLLTKFLIGKSAVKGDKATVPVTFSNAGRRERLVFRLNKAGRSWKIENIVYTDGSDLIKILSAPLN